MIQEFFSGIYLTRVPFPLSQLFHTVFVRLISTPRFDNIVTKANRSLSPIDIKNCPLVARASSLNPKNPKSNATLTLTFLLKPRKSWPGRAKSRFDRIKHRKFEVDRGILPFHINFSFLFS